jgi:hypothetical protein
VSAVVGIAMLVGGVLFFTTTIAYAFGRYQSAAEIDETFEVAKMLGAHGAILRMEAEALGVTVEELLARDAALARQPSIQIEMTGNADEFVKMLRESIRKTGGGDVGRALGSS